MRILIFLATLLFFQCKAQDMPTKSNTLPYQQIPDYPTEYNGATIAARTIDGLGYRYYWATEGLRAEDLTYQTGEDARTTSETLEHLLGLSKMIVHSMQEKANVRPSEEAVLSFAEMRRQTLLNLETASNILKKSTDQDLEKYKIIFQRDDTKSEFSFWHQLNGPIADALWHTGQIVAFRRASGNPINPKVNVFMGKTRE